MRTRTSSTRPARAVPTEIFSLLASTTPAPATVLPNGVRGGSTGGGGCGGFCCPRTTWMIENTSMPAARIGST